VTQSPQRLVVELAEWDEVGPDRDARLKGLSLGKDPVAQKVAESLRNQLEIREGYQGLTIRTKSFVGRVDVGPLTICVTPKLPGLPLARLLRYAYGLRDIKVVDLTEAPTARFGLQDLLVSLLVGEVEELLRRGLARRYVCQVDNLDAPRGRILIDQVIRQGGVKEARLPCSHFQRRTDWHLNQVLLGGLEVAARITGDRDLRRRVHKLCASFDGVGRTTRLDGFEVGLAEQALTRQTEASRSALTIIKLLLDALGLSFDSQQELRPMPGFMFDMNMFFQRLLSRFLHEHLEAAQIVDELAIRSLFAYSPEANPKKRGTPSPRPDFALFREGTLRGFLDAKYRDVWAQSFSPEWLYQLSIYALASPSDTSVLLYASMALDACDEKIEVRQPIRAPTKLPASVIMRPVHLPYLASLLSSNQSTKIVTDRRRLADHLIALSTLQRSSVEVDINLSGAD
jgi:5-methylcytosine-specific restriction enzyme subunit McrC